jgi:hypothetical protein
MRFGIEVPNSAAAPATVSGELVPQSHWENPGKAVTGADPQARRPAVTSIGYRAGCLGVDLAVAAMRVALVNRASSSTPFDVSQGAAGDVGRNFE